MKSRTEQVNVSPPADANIIGNGLDATVTPASSATAEVAGGFNPDDYRYTLGSAGPGVRKQLSIPVGRPKQFFKLDPRPEYRLEIAGYAHKDNFEPEHYIVGPQVQLLLGERYVRRTVIRVCVVRPHVVQLWPLVYPSSDGRSNNWIETQWDVASLAESQWVRFEMNESRTGWDAVIAANQWPEPEWPTEPMSELIEKGYKGKFINGSDHAILRQMRGEI